MKRSIKFVVTTAALAALLSITPMASDTPGTPATAKGGAVALNALNSTRSPVVSAPAKPMVCVNCTDFVVTRRDLSSKGGAGALSTPATIYVSQHGCKKCDTTIGVAGHGKAKVDVRSHKCAACL